MKKIIIISGPTSSGKSEIGIKIAKEINAEIINADSFQIYDQLKIGVNKPSQSYLKEVKHHLIGHIGVEEEWSIAHFLAVSFQIIDQSTKNIVVIGGSTLYIDALINNYKLDNPKRDSSLNDFSCEELVQKISLHHKDLINNSVLHDHNRLSRMYQNILKDNINQLNPQKYHFYHIFVNQPREKLYEKINQRTDLMFANGWVEEVQTLAKLYDFEKFNAFKAIGYLDILKNNFIIDEKLKEKIKQQTRNYAKRQLTWCRNKFKFDFEYSNPLQIELLKILVKNFLDEITPPKSMYIHIPFCKSICSYCDFPRVLLKVEESNIFIDDLVEQINGIKETQKTIYIGGGTPNCLSKINLEKLLKSFANLIDSETEFTIELNPEFVTLEQIEILKKYGINRISMGVQSLNEKILTKIGRVHNVKTINHAMGLLKDHFSNISCDFIYNLPQMQHSDIDDIINFINYHQIKHISFYALEIKEGSFMNKLNYQIDETTEVDHMLLIQEALNKKTKLRRYEVSNWAISPNFYSQHNLVYWNMNQWYGIGNGATGFYEKYYLKANGDNKDYHYLVQNISIIESYQDIIMMGLRTINGLNLNHKNQSDAFNYFKKELEPFLIKDGSHLKVANIDLLNEVLLKII